MLKFEEMCFVYSNEGIVFNWSRVVDVIFTASPDAFSEVFAAFLCSTGRRETKLGTTNATFSFRLGLR